jgi:AhpD family alkylhydroperoxidase
MAIVIARSRLDIFRRWPEGLRAMQALDAAIGSSNLDPSLLELIRIRASQLNRCAFCLELHTRQALALGEDPARLRQLSVWQDSPLFTERERAALALTDAITPCERDPLEGLIESGRSHFDRDELVQLVYAIAMINAWNRLAVTDATSCTETDAAV